MDASRPAIAISTPFTHASYGVWHQHSAVLPAGYVDAVRQAGGLALLVAPQPELVTDPDALLDRVDGLIISGGVDMDPSTYGADPHPETKGCTPERDAFEIALLRRAVELDMPVLGVCRGMQLLNVATGGTLVQHLAEADGVVHKGPPGTFTTHDVAVMPGTLLHGMVGDAVAVHSCHHQGIDRLGEGLSVTAHAPDGVVEGIELPGDRFAVGVLWHPEEHAELGGPLFRGLVEAATPAPAL